MLPTLIAIGSFKIHTFGVMVALGFIVGMSYCKWEAIRIGEDANRILDLTFWIMISGILGARALFIATEWSLYAAHPIEILYIWKGGLVWYGGFIAAFLTALYYMRRRGMPIWPTSDLVAPGVMLGLSFGRIGCLTAGDDHGRLVVSALGKIGHKLLAEGTLFDQTGRVTEYARTQIFAAGIHAPWWTVTLNNRSLVQPDLVDLPLYPSQPIMSLYCVGIFVFLVLWKNRQSFHGEILWLMTMIYAICRYFLEYFRGDLDRGYFVSGMITTSQGISIGVFAIGLVMYLYCRKHFPARIAVS